MLKKFTELKSKIDKCDGVNIYDLIAEITEAYEKGTIDCREYIRLYGFAVNLEQEVNKEQ